MENKKSTLRFIYPQWQGGIVDHWMPDIPAEDSSRGYYLGAQLLNYLAPQTAFIPYRGRHSFESGRIRSKFRFHWI